MLKPPAFPRAFSDYCARSERRALVCCRYPAEYTSSSYSFQGLYGYKVFLAIALILGDALYNLVKVMYKYSVRLYEIYRLGIREKEMTEEEFDEGEPSL